MIDRGAGGTGITTPELGFRKEFRLRNATEFSLVLANHRRLRGAVFELHYLSQESRPVGEPVGARLGVVIAKKLVQRAVQRNLLKRLARETFRIFRQGLPHYDLVLRLAKSPGRDLDSETRRTWRADIEQLLIRLPR